MDFFKDTFEVFFRIDNPIFYTFFLVLVILFILNIIFKHILKPLKQKHIIEKQELELKNTRAMALFAELDPRPLVRLNVKGDILNCNEPAVELGFGNNGNAGTNKLLKPIMNNIERVILGEDFTTELEIHGKSFEVVCKGDPHLEIAHLYFQDVSSRVQNQKELLNTNVRISDYSLKIQNELERQRQSIARELHDSIGQNLLSIRLNLENLFNGNGKSHETLKIIDSTIEELREISSDLKPKILEEVGVGAALTLLVERLTKNSKLKGSIDISKNLSRFNKEFELTIYRITQEALNNIIKHSQASEFNIQFFENGTMLKLIISDDGVGVNKEFSLSHPHGFGLMNIRERVQFYNGEFSIESHHGSGTTLHIEIPKSSGKSAPTSS